VFLAALVLIDSYKLIPERRIVMAILFGGAIAAVCYFVNPALHRITGIPWTKYTWYISPVVEEGFKAFPVIWLIRRSRIAFMVDALIYGFAIGAGFALVENANAFNGLGDRSMIVWVIRGFGTAIMHGGVTAVMSVVSQYHASHHGSRNPVVYLPGLAIAVVIHSLFNHFVVPAQFAPVVIIVSLSVVVGVTVRASERGTRRWLGVQFDTDQELLEMINTGRAAESRVGDYLTSLRDRFPGEVVADMLCMLRIHLELSVRAKGILLMREAGFKTEPDPDVGEKLDELKYLEKSIGHAGLLAIKPMLNMSDRELWQLHMVKET
jgi:RsiW-degrading membrane proteinase PrsW (M82 family)